MSISNYVDLINSVLRPSASNGPLVIDLFAGCGGLSLGFEALGFCTIGYERNADCCATYNRNLRGECVKAHLTTDFRLPSADVIIGGPPCQPFSVVGKQNGPADERDGFPAFLYAVRHLKPEIFLFENVRGLFYRSKPYLEHILQLLRDENYIVEYRLLNAVDYGVPQNRERVIVVGHRGRFEFPRPSLCRVTAGEAIGDLAVSTPLESKFLTESMDKYIAAYEAKSCCVRPRDLHLDIPARTLTCRNLAGATSDMQRVRLPDGRRRRLLLREACRLQSFPDWFDIIGNETSQFNQVGNAVPPLMAYHIAGSVRAYLESNVRFTPEEIRFQNKLYKASDSQQLSLY